MFKPKLLVFKLGSRPALQPEAAETGKKIKYNKQQLSAYLDTKIPKLDKSKLQSFAKKMPKTWSPNVNADFLKKVFGMRVEGQSEERINIIVEGMQLVINNKYPKLKIDGKIGQQTVKALTAIVAIDHGPEFSNDFPTNIQHKFKSVKEADIVKCGKIKGQKQRNEYFWTKVLNLDMREGNAKQKADHIKKQIKHLQTYIGFSLNINIASDGFVGPKTLKVFSKFLIKRKKRTAFDGLDVDDADHILDNKIAPDIKKKLY